MRAVVQRVLEASVHVGGRQVAATGPGLLVYLGLEKGDGPNELAWMAAKIPGIRVFEDEGGKMNVLLVSQFTLAGDLSRGRRPGFDRAMPVDEARTWWPAVVAAFRNQCPRLATGEFQAAMKVSSVNDGPATFWLEITPPRRPDSPPAPKP